MPPDTSKAFHKFFVLLILSGGMVLQGYAQTKAGEAPASPKDASKADPVLSYTYTCNNLAYNGNGLNTTKCCQPGQTCNTYVGAGPNGYFAPQPNFETSDPYSGVLNPNQKLQLTLICASRQKVKGVNLDKNSKIKCDSSEQQKGTKILSCHNKSNSSHHTWNLIAYNCKNSMN